MEQNIKRYLALIEQEKIIKTEKETLRDLIVKGVTVKRDEGTVSENHGGFRMSVSYKLKRKLDYENYVALDLPEEMGFVKLDPKIDLKKLRHVEYVDSALVAQCVTSTPAKPSIKIEVLP